MYFVSVIKTRYKSVSHECKITRKAISKLFSCNSLREKCPYLELFWSVFSRIRTGYGEILRISTYSVRMRENTDQNNSYYGHILRSDNLTIYQNVAREERLQFNKEKMMDFDCYQREI